MGASQQNQTQVAARNKVDNVPLINSNFVPQNVEKCDELFIRTSTWTRESHGLYDFEGKDVQLRSFKIKGSQFIYRKESEVNIEQVNNYSKMRFNEDEDGMITEKRDTIIGRILIKDGKYWLFHRHLVDEGL